MRTSRLLIVVLGIVALLGMHSESLDRLWEAHFLANIRFPPLRELDSVVWFGIIGALALLLGVLVTGLLASRMRLDRSRVLRGADGARVDPTPRRYRLCACGKLFLALVAYLATGLARAVGGPTFYAWINAEIDSSKRATLLSIINQSDAVGQWVGGPAIGAVGAAVSLRAALGLGALVLLPVLPLFTCAGNQENDKEEVVEVGEDNEHPLPAVRLTAMDAPNRPSENEVRRSQHIVLASAAGEGFASLRRPATPRRERYAVGRALRQQVPRSTLATWSGSDGRRDPVQQIVEAHEGRLDWLIPVRVSRMIASPYSFLRGTAGIMAEDFAGLPSTGITPVICGDAHLSNFGFYASPERELVFDLNDFDEAHPGAWEWDLRRLVTSVWVAGRQNGSAEEACKDAVARCVASYRKQVAYLAEQPLLTRSYERLDLDRLRLTATQNTLRQEIERAATRARRRTSDRALPRFTEQRDGTRRIVEEPPLITRPDPLEAEQITVALDAYLPTLPPHWARALAGYAVVDIAHKVVGVGSVGLRAYVALCEGSSPDDVVFLQLKQARRSVIARFVHGDSAWHVHQGQRVVEYQQALQTVSDPLLGWTTVGAHQYYVRQFRDMKGAITVDGLDASALADYAGICGFLLAKSHARTSGASMIAGYLGSSDKADRALCRFARAYADQTESDHQALVAAVAHGALPASVGSD